MLLGSGPTTFIWQALTLHHQILTLNFAGEFFCPVAKRNETWVGELIFFVPLFQHLLSNNC